MEIKQREKYKSEFKSQLEEFTHQLEKYCSTEDGDWTIKGFIDVYKNIYTISSDTKIISKILEIHIFPLILEFARIHKYKIVLAEKQNWYPDLTFIKEENENVIFALDIKTTYRRNGSTVGFTLGSHGGYFKERDKDKNIQYPYNKYLGHYVLGVIYTRTDTKETPDTEIFHVEELDEGETYQEKIGERKVTEVKKLKSIVSVIKNFDFFSAEKWKIASDQQGSGNTANIGCVLSINDLKKERGIFSYVGENWFDDYWISYPIEHVIDGKTVKIKNLKEFLIYRNKENLWKQVLKQKEKEGKENQKKIK
jgi:hypothetical protein